MRLYLKLLSKRVFRLQFEGTDFISTIFTALLGAADHFYPTWGIDMEVISWQTPLFLLGFAFLLRIISAPYFIWKEEKEKLEALQIREGQTVILQSYSKYVGRIFVDLIENWRESGIHSGGGLFGKLVVPPSFKAWHYLEDLSVDLNLPEELRHDIRLFLSNFYAHNNALDGLLAHCYIKTKFETKEALELEKPEIAKLAQSLSERLKNVRREERSEKAG